MSELGTSVSDHERYPMTLSFALVRCTCGGRRVRGVVCPDCGTGADWFEVDVEWQRRSRIVGRLLAAMNERVAPETDELELDYLATFSELADLTPRFFRGLQQLAEQKDDAHGEMEDVCRSAVRLRARLQACQPPRPWVLAGGTGRAAAEGLVQVIRVFLRAFGARTPLEAQTLSAKAQRALDDVVEPICRLNELRDRWDAIATAEDVGDWVGNVFADAAEISEATDFVELDAWGVSLYERITGRAPASGAGLGLLVHHLWSQLIGDEDKFNCALASADALISRNKSTFQTILKREGARAELQNGYLQMADEAAATNAVIAAAINDRQTARSLMGLMHTIFEGPGRRFAGLFLELVGQGTVEDYLTCDGAYTIEKAQRHQVLGEALYGMNKALRIAHAHQSYEVVDDHLVVRARSKTASEGEIIHISLTELLDRFLAAAECINALSLAIQVHALAVGVDLCGPEVLASLGFGPAEQATVLLAADGYQDIVIEAGATPIRVTVTGHVLSLTAMSAIGSAYPEHEKAVVCLRAGDGTSEWVIQPAAMHANGSAPDGIVKEIQFQEVLVGMSVDGVRCWTDANVTHWIAGKATQVLTARPLGDAYPAVMRDLRALVTFSKTRQNEGLVAALRGIMRFLRLTAEGRDGERDFHAFDALARYGADEPPALPFAIAQRSG